MIQYQKSKKKQLAIFQLANVNVMDLYFYIGKVIDDIKNREISFWMNYIDQNLKSEFHNNWYNSN